jgi:hypothetical protein
VRSLPAVLPDLPFSERKKMKFPFYFIAMKIIEGIFLFGLMMLGAWKLLELVGRWCQ